jgi:hypothetical protein
MKCIVCDTETGSDKRRTCSGSCRAKAQRERTRTLHYQAHALERTRPDADVVKGGVCWCCGTEIHEALVWQSSTSKSRSSTAQDRRADAMLCLKEKTHITEQTGVGEGWPFAGADKVPTPNLSI